MNRDHGLFLLIGLLAGFMLGYLGHEAMSDLQPARLAAGAAPGVAPPAAQPAAGATPAVPMEEIQRLKGSG